MNKNRKIIFKNAGAWLITAVCLFVFLPIEAPAQRTKQRPSKKAAVQKKVVSKKPQKKSVAKNSFKKNTGSSPSSVRAQQRELLKIQSAIHSTRSQLKSLSKKESSTLQKLAVHEKHSTQVSRHINLLENHVAVLKDSITIAKRNEQMLQSRLAQLQEMYGKIAQEFHKAGEVSTDELITTGRASDTDIRRAAYMKALTQKLNRHVHQMAEVKDSIARQQQLLKAHTAEQNMALKTKAAEQNELERSILEKKKALDEIRSNKQLLQQELAKKEKSARQIGSMINRLIAEEIQKREARRREVLKKREERKLAQKKPENKKPIKGESPNLASNERGAFKKEEKIEEIPDYTKSAFARNSLVWPVGSRKILRGFGQYRNPSTNTVTDNPGIDISASRGSGVQAISGGVVSLLHWLPGYGSLIIIDHENGFRSVYANLASVSVSEGQRVSGGGTIGRSGESVDGEFLHFELWRERQRLNPTSWLR